MNPLRLFNPWYTLSIERQLVKMSEHSAALAEASIDLADKVMALDAQYPTAAQKLILQQRENLQAIADYLGTGRVSDAKVMVDALIMLINHEARPN